MTVTCIMAAPKGQVVELSDVIGHSKFFSDLSCGTEIERPVHCHTFKRKSVQSMGQAIDTRRSIGHPGADE